MKKIVKTIYKKKLVLSNLITTDPKIEIETERNEEEEKIFLYKSKLLI